ncbi:MAG: hypothetical protein ACRC6L_11240 [Steroidobacteraceae bacterium]
MAGVDFTDQFANLPMLSIGQRPIVGLVLRQHSRRHLTKREMDRLGLVHAQGIG